ncbi:hypothetical protein MBLNU459_g0515t2 [Dothideomycetes sp. NU459]
MSKQDFPIVFTVGGSGRHEVIFVNPGLSIQDISSKVESLVPASKNCEEPLSKYKKKGETEKVTEIKMRWSREGRDTTIFPKATVITEDNIEAVLSLANGHDVLDIEMAAAPTAEGEKKE